MTNRETACASLRQTPLRGKRIVARCPRHHANRLNPCLARLSRTEWNERLRKTDSVDDKNPGIVTGTGPGEDWSGGGAYKHSHRGRRMQKDFSDFLPRADLSRVAEASPKKSSASTFQGRCVDQVRLVERPVLIPASTYGGTGA